MTLLCFLRGHDWDIVKFKYHSVFQCVRKGCDARTWLGQPHEYEREEKICMEAHIKKFKGEKM